jgi:hypothetical protein
MTPNKPKLLQIICIEAKSKFRTVPSWKSALWIIAQYKEQGGKFNTKSAEDMEGEKKEAVAIIEKALKKNGFTKIDDNSFVIGDGRLQSKTIANLLEISKAAWYQYLINDPVQIVAKTQTISIKKGDYFSIMAWKNDGALVSTSKMGNKAFKLPTNTALALIHSSRTLTTRERRFRS